MDDKIQRALESDRTIDITTIGRRSGRSCGIEIWFYRTGGRIYLSGSPGRRSWVANLLANPELTFHLKGSVQADLRARARPVTDLDERRAVFTRILEDLRMSRDLEAWISGSPLMEVTFLNG